MAATDAKENGASNATAIQASSLFKPLKVGSITLAHRIVMSPMTRRRTDAQHAPLDIVAEYFSQRAVTPGTLLITEAVNPTAWCSGSGGPHIETPSQVAAWKKVADAVHARGSHIFLQLVAHGRTAIQQIRDQEGTGQIMSSSAVIMPVETRAGQGSGIYMKPPTMPREMTEEDIARVIQEMAAGAKRAVFDAGFDGVEVHGAHGFMIDQFTQLTCNKRTDRWGGSAANRSRFGFEVAKAVVNAIGADRTGYRISPWNSIRGMGMKDESPEQFCELIRQLRTLKLAYMHIVEASQDRDGSKTEAERSQTLPLIKLWTESGSPVFLNAAHDPESAREAVDIVHKGKDVAMVFGRHFLANPDLVSRIWYGHPLNPWRREYFYQPAEAIGFTDYLEYDAVKDRSSLRQ